MSDLARRQIAAVKRGLVAYWRGATDRRYLTWMAAAGVLTFALSFGLWVWDESLQPGQQYADPLLPCLFVGCLGMLAGHIARSAACIIRHFLVWTTKRRRWGNGWITGYRTGEWWIGFRRDFAMDATVFGLFGLTLIIPDEYWRRRR